jgi:hypothetical protein
MMSEYTDELTRATELDWTEQWPGERFKADLDDGTGWISLNRVSGGLIIDIKYGEVEIHHFDEEVGWEPSSFASAAKVALECLPRLRMIREDSLELKQSMRQWHYDRWE